MKQILCFLALFCLQGLSAQPLRLRISEVYTVTEGASGMVVSTYEIYLDKGRKYCGRIDSVVSTRTGEKIDYKFYKVEMTDSTRHRVRADNFHSKDKGVWAIVFGIRKQRGTGRPGAPQNLKADTTNVEGGVTIYYTANRKRGTLRVETFTQTENLIAP
jgi:hypothetical protein